MDQMFAVRQVCNKYLANVKDSFWEFMDLEKSYEMTDRHSMWHIVGVYGVGGKLLNAAQSFYANGISCFWVGMDAGEWFPDDVGLRQGCVMSPRLFNVYMDGVKREVSARVLAECKWCKCCYLLVIQHWWLIQRRSCVDWRASLVQYMKDKS